MALEQLDPKLCFQRAHLLGHRALGDVEFLGGGLKGEMSAGRFKGAKAVEGWEVFHKEVVKLQACGVNSDFRRGLFAPMLH
ncbi:hypothetical protein NBRC116590_14540 [Pelagimonas sp. KU-00592-HH]